MDAFKNVKGKSNKVEKFDDPELEAECQYAKENGLTFSRSLSSGNGKSFSRSLSSSESSKRFPEQYMSNGVSLERVLPKMLKNEKANRKARSRGVSGCSTKKDGGRFEYGLDCIDMYNDSASDSDDGYDEYADYVFNYSDTEIRSIVQDYLSNGGNKEEALIALEKFRITSDTSYRMVKDLVQLSLENSADGGVELGCELVEEIVKQKWISQPVLVNILEDITESLAEMCIDSPKVVEATSIFLAKLVEHDLLSCSVLRLLSTQNAIKANNGEQNAKTGITALEKMHDNVMTQLSDLLHEMYNNGILLNYCLQKGYERLFNSLSDLYYDLPAAYQLANRWVQKSLKAGFLSDTVAKNARGRTLSEGPDGKLFCMESEADTGDDISSIQNGIQNLETDEKNAVAAVVNN